MNKYAPAGIFPAQRQAFANAIGNETNWYQLLLKVAHINPVMIGGLLKTFVVDANFLAWGKQERMRAKYGCNIPWAILLDPTSACNLHCLGRWAADYGHKLNLTFEDIDSIICQVKKLGVHVYIYTGGEPLVRKDDVIALCRKHPDCAFLCFTNATLIDEKFCQDLIEVKNFTPPSAPRASRRPPTRGEAREPTSAFGTAWTCCARMPFRSASLPVIPAKTQAPCAPRSASTG